MRIAIVFNPKSGKRNAGRVVTEVAGALAPHNHELEVIDCATQRDFEDDLRARAETYDRVIVIGGDGTLNAAVNAITFSQNASLPLAFVPTGRGKDTARTLGSWKPAEMGNGAFALSGPRAIDLVKITLQSGVERYAINVTSMGLSAQAVVVANKIPRVFGSLGYVIGAGSALAPPRPYTLTMRVDDEPIVIPNALMIAACNGTAFGGGIYLSPDARQDDGLMDIAVVHNANLGDLALQLGKLRKGKLREHPALSRWQAQRVEIESLTASYWEADGELLSSQPSIFQSAPKALYWVSP